MLLYFWYEGSTIETEHPVFEVLSHDCWSLSFSRIQTRFTLLILKHSLETKKLSTLFWSFFYNNLHEQKKIKNIACTLIIKAWKFKQWFEGNFKKNMFNWNIFNLILIRRRTSKFTHFYVWIQRLGRANRCSFCSIHYLSTSGFSIFLHLATWKLSLSLSLSLSLRISKKLFETNFLDLY